MNTTIPLVSVRSITLEIERLTAGALADSIRRDLADANAAYYSACAKLNLALSRRDWELLGYADADSYIYAEFGISPSWGYALRRVDELRRQFPGTTAGRLIDLDIAKAATVAAAFPQDKQTRRFDADPASVAGLLDQARTLPLRELREQVREQRGDGAPPGAFPWIICPHCHQKVEVTRRTDVVGEE